MGPGTELLCPAHLVALHLPAALGSHAAAVVVLAFRAEGGREAARDGAHDAASGEAAVGAAACGADGPPACPRALGAPAAGLARMWQPSSPRVRGRDGCRDSHEKNKFIDRVQRCAADREPRLRSCFQGGAWPGVRAVPAAVTLSARPRARTRPQRRRACTFSFLLYSIPLHSLSLSLHSLSFGTPQLGRCPGLAAAPAAAGSGQKASSCLPRHFIVPSTTRLIV